MEKLFLHYSKINLSLLGKITVIKTLAVPQLVYLLTVLPSPGKAFFDQIDKLFKSFIWGRSTKIKLRQLEQDISQGGLKLTNLRFLHYGLKLSWIKRLVNTEGGWQSLFEHVFNMEKFRFWELDTKSIFDICSAPDTNPFWSEVFKIWIEYKEFYTSFDPRCYPLWGTSFIKNTNLLKLRTVFESYGLHYLNDILNRAGEIYGYEDLCNKVNKRLNFVDYFSLKHSIPRKWRIGLQDKLDQNKVEQLPLTNLLKMPKICKGVYQKFLEKEQVIRPHKQKWSLALTENIQEEDWEYFYKSNFQCTIDSKLRSFQYKVLLRAIPTNKYLLQCKLKDSDKCYFCNQTTESLEHLLWFCPQVQTFWDKFRCLFNPRTFPNNSMTAKSVLLGYRGNEDRIINHMFNLAKYYIFMTKCRETKLDFEQFKRTVVYTYKLESKIAHDNASKNMDFYSKWYPLYAIIMNSNNSDWCI